MAILVPEQGSIGLGESRITVRDTFAGMKDPGNKGAGLASLAKALGELGSVFGDLEAKQRQRAEEMGNATAYWDATVEGANAGYDGQVGPGKTVGERAPSLFDVNNWNSRGHSKVELKKRQIAGSKETADWLSSDEGSFENMPYEVWSNPEYFERAALEKRQQIIERYRGDKVAGSAALEEFDGEVNRWRNRYGTQRIEQHKKDESENRKRRLDGVIDDNDLDDPAEISSLEGEAPANSAYKTRGRPVVPEVQQAVEQVAGKTWMADYMIATARVESSGGRNVANPRSSARGPWQFIKDTGRRYGLQSESARLDPFLSAQAMAKLTLDNQKGLRKALGREPSFAELYLAHQQGMGGAIKLLSNPNARAADIVGAKAVKLNGGKMNMTGREFAALWLNKFNKINGLDGARGGSVPDSEFSIADAAGVAKRDAGIQIASNDPNFLPDMGAAGEAGKSWAEERYGPDADEGRYDTEIQTTEYDYVENDEGEKVLDVPEDPDVIRLYRRILKVDADEQKTSVMSPQERRDDYWGYVKEKVLETNDPKWFDALPKQWLTQEQRAEITTMREQIADERWKDHQRTRELDNQRRIDLHREKENDAVTRAAAGEDIDPKREAMGPDGKIDKELYDKLTAIKNQPRVDTATSKANAVTMEAGLANAAFTGDYTKFGFERGYTPTVEELATKIATSQELNPTEKADLLGKVDNLLTSGQVANSQMVSEYYNDTFDVEVKTLIGSTQAIYGKTDPQLISSLAQTEKVFKKEVRRRVLDFVTRQGRQPNVNDMYGILEAAEEKARLHLDKLSEKTKSVTPTTNALGEDNPAAAKPAKPAQEAPKFITDPETGIRRLAKPGETEGTF